jgi:hypothetical protein
MAGPGRAVPEGTRSLTCLRKDIVIENEDVENDRY